MGNARLAERVRGEVEAAEGVQPQTPADARLRHRPDSDGRCRLTRELHRHRRVGERHLKNEERVDPSGARDFRHRFLSGGGVVEQLLRPDRADARRLDGGEGLPHHFFRIGNVECRPSKRGDPVGQTHRQSPKPLYICRKRASGGSICGPFAP